MVLFVKLMLVCYRFLWVVLRQLYFVCLWICYVCSAYGLFVNSVVVDVLWCLCLFAL